MLTRLYVVVLYQRLVDGKPRRMLPARDAAVTVVDRNTGEVQTDTGFRS
jgi:hypothetical protein